MEIPNNAIQTNISKEKQKQNTNNWYKISEMQYGENKKEQN
jgi:hypothetical protein